MVRQRGSQTAGGVAAATGIPPDPGTYVSEVGFSRGDLEHRRRENKTTGLRLTYRPCCFLLGVSGGSRPAGAAHPPAARQYWQAGVRRHRAWRHRGPAVRGPAVWRRGLAALGSCGPGSGGVGVSLCWWSGGLVVWWSGSSGPGLCGLRVGPGPGLGLGLGLGFWGLGVGGVRGVGQGAVDGQGRRRGYRHTRHSCCAGEGRFDYSDCSQAAAGAGPAGAAG